jgi:catechol 2,3-dioxygenase-like lactoylglutathione lyase family enzyme
MAVTLVLLPFSSLPAIAQTQAPQGRALGIEVLMFIVADLDRSVHFYHDVLGMEMFRPPTEWAATQGILDLTNTTGSFRYASLRAPNSPLHLDLIEYKDTQRKPVRIPRFQDPGAASLILFVRDIDNVNAKLTQAHARTITNGQVLQNTTPNSAKVIFAQDPDGFFVGLSQREPTPENNAPANSNIIADEMIFTVADVDQALRIYQDALGFKFPQSSFVTNQRINEGGNTPGAQVRRTQARIPDRTGSPLTGNLVFIQYKDVDRDASAPRSGIQEPGTTILSFPVPELEPMADALKAAGLELISRKGPSVSNTRSRDLIFRDPNTIYVEIVQHPKSNDKS